LSREATDGVELAASDPDSAPREHPVARRIGAFNKKDP
jgi:hypothetical protein